jgi:beta-lactam-binding protein with PASTA domain
MNVNNNQESDDSYDEQSLNLTDFDIADAVRFLKENNIEFEIEGPKKNAVVVDQSVTRGNTAGTIEKVLLITKNNTESKSVKDNIKMPDIKGLSLRKCVKLVSSLGFDYKINGSGKVISQIPEAGSVLAKNQQIVINCESVN